MNSNSTVPNPKDIVSFETLFNETPEGTEISKVLKNNFVNFSLIYEDFDDFFNLGVVICNSNVEILYVNNEVLRLGEFTESIAGMNLLEAYSSRHVRDYYTNEVPDYDMEKLLAFGTNKYTKIKALNKITVPSGRIITVQTMLIPLMEADGKFGFMMLFYDIEHGSKNVENISEESKLLNILSQSPLSILSIDLDTMKVYDCNEAFSKMTRYDRQSIIGNNIEKIQLIAMDNERYFFLDCLSKRRDIINMKTTINTKDGDELICELSTGIVNIAGRRIVVLYFVDITSKVSEEIRKTNLLNSLEGQISERDHEIDTINKDLQKQIYTRQISEKQLEISARKYSFLVESLPVGIYRMNTRGEYLECNPAFLSIFGFDSLVDVQMNTRNSYIFNSLNLSKYDLNDITEMSFPPVEVHLKTKYKNNIWVQNYAHIYVDDNGEQIIGGVVIDITANKQAESALARSEMKYRSLFENMNDIYISFNSMGIVTNISPSFGRVTGLNTNNMLNKHFSLLLNKDAVNTELINSFNKVTNSKTFTIAFKNFVKSTPGYFSLNLQAIYDTNGNVVGYEGIARDVTVELEHSNKISTLFDISAAINESETFDELFYKIHKTIGKVLYAKNFFIALLKDNKKDIYFPYYKDEHSDEIPETISIDHPESYTAKVIRDRKSYIFKYGYDEAGLLVGNPSLSWLGVPLKLKNEVIGAIVLHSYTNLHEFDETQVNFLQSVSDQIAVAIDRKNAQLNLDQQYKFVSNLIDLIPFPIYFRDLKVDKLKLVNNAFAEIMNMTKDEILFGDTSVTLDGEIGARHSVYTQTLIDTKEDQNFEESIIHDGKERHYSTLMNGVYNTSGQLEGILGVLIDISDQKKANLAMNDALNKERELGQMKTQFVSMVSHEFKTPLQSILLSIELLQEYSDKMSSDDKIKQYDRIRSTISSLNVLLNDVLLINRSERGKTQFHPQDMDLPALIHNIVDSLKEVNFNKVNINIDMEETSKLVKMDERLMQLVITNLVNNAIKYSRKNGNVGIKAMLDDKMAHIEISDDGIGIPEKDMEHLFTPFHRSSNVGKIAGTGLGLSIVKDSIVKHGGTIRCESKENVGTKFILDVPYAK